MSSEHVPDREFEELFRRLRVFLFMESQAKKPDYRTAARVLGAVFQQDTKTLRKRFIRQPKQRPMVHPILGL